VERKGAGRDFGLLLLGLPIDPVPRWEIGGEVWRQVGHVGFGGGQRSLHPPHARRRLPQLRSPRRRKDVSRTRSGTFNPSFLGVPYK